MATAWDQLVEKLLTQESSEEMVELRKMLLRRLATETEFVSGACSPQYHRDRWLYQSATQG